MVLACALLIFAQLFVQHFEILQGALTGRWGDLIFGRDIWRIVVLMFTETRQLGRGQKFFIVFE